MCKLIQIAFKAYPNCIKNYRGIFYQITTQNIISNFYDSQFFFFFSLHISNLYSVASGPSSEFQEFSDSRHTTYIKFPHFVTRAVDIHILNLHFSFQTVQRDISFNYLCSVPSGGHSICRLKIYLLKILSSHVVVLQVCKGQVLSIFHIVQVHSNVGT